MAMNMDLWKIKSGEIKLLSKSRLESEKQLEDWIEKDSSVLGIDLLIIGRQVSTPNGGRIDLLAMNSDADVTIIELKKDKTPREVVPQALDYASWVKPLSFPELDQIAKDHKGKDLSSLFSEFFGTSLPESVNSSHSMLIVASELDESSERIIKYLTEEYKVNVNAVFFNFSRDGENEFLGRAWLLDQEEVQDKSESRKARPWSGYWFVNGGEEEGEHRTWEDSVKYGYIGAGQGPKYSQALSRLKPGNQIFAYQKGIGYVGYGEVTQESVPIGEFIDPKSGKRMIDLPMKAAFPQKNIEDPDKSEYAVGVKWIKTFPLADAKTFKGVFANQNIVCKLQHQQTLDFVKREFGVE